MRFTWLNFFVACLAAIGALNWGAVGMFDRNIVRSIFGTSKSTERTIYSIVGLAGLLMLLNLILSKKVTPIVNFTVPGYEPEGEVYEP